MLLLIDFQKNYRHNRDNVPYLNIRVRITLTEKSAFVLESLNASFGGFLEYRDKAKIYKDHQNWQPAVTWNLTGSRAYGLLQNIKNHLLIKKNQAEFAMKYYLFEPDKAIQGKHIIEERDKILKFRLDIYNELKAMKQDPHRLSEPTEIFNKVSDAIVEATEKSYGSVG